LSLSEPTMSLAPRYHSHRFPPVGCG
jgi:hypothetical protein